jgi:hypothetical protein
MTTFTINTAIIELYGITGNGNVSGCVNTVRNGSFTCNNCTFKGSLMSSGINTFGVYTHSVPVSFVDYLFESATIMSGTRCWLVY